MQVWSTKCRFSSYHPCWYKTRRAHYQNLKWEKTFFLRQHDVVQCIFWEMQWAHLVSSLILSEFSSKSAKDLQRVPNGLWEDPACRFSKPEVKNSSCGTWLVSPPGNLLFDCCHYHVSSLLHFKKLTDNWMHKLTNNFLKLRKIETHAELNSEHTWWGEGGISNLKVTQWLSPSSHTVTIFWVFSR